ncbi:abortive phage infection protein [Bacillus kexueae]|uniref:abortive phage infection protein n=1 Tax=Aeribacillus kexueae TaxID=2078952 RepID=UPI001FAE7F4F|nr:abortive phage infection protein [Bacillus kexueae]
MEESLIHEILDQLKNGERSEFTVTKEQFMPFRNVLVKREDFKHFRGNAQHGGTITYTYLKEPRS